MGDAKKRGSFNERKIQALKLKSNSEYHLETKNSDASSEPHLLQFTRSIEDSLILKNYFAALIMALTLPDICCSLADENKKTTGKKYSNWFKNYVGHHYTSQIGSNMEEIIFLSGEECFALRCTYLHKGTNNIEDEKIVKDYMNKSSKIEFVAEMNSDCVKMNDILLLKLELFCYRIIEGVTKWLKDSEGNDIINSHMKEIPKIYTKGFSPIPGVFISG